MRLRDLLVAFVKKVILSFVLTVIIYNVVDNYINIDITINGSKVKFLFIIFFFIIFIYVFLETVYFVFKNKTNKIKYDYYRELPRDYSPSMVSFLMNLKLEYKKDILSDLIFLEERKIIKIDNNQNIIISKDNNWKNYENHLCLLIQKIEEMNNPTINNFLDNIDSMFQSQYNSFIIIDLKNLGLIEDYTHKDLLKKVIIVFIAIVMLLCVIFMNIVFFIFLIPLFGVLLLLFFLVYKFLGVYNKFIGKDFIRSKKGKEDVSLWISYDKFIRHFSIMDERELEEKNLWGYYFAYGLALGINTKVIKKFGLEYEKYIIY